VEKYRNPRATEGESIYNYKLSQCIVTNCQEMQKTKGNKKAGDLNKWENKLHWNSINFNINSALYESLVHQANISTGNN
jgi:hypothetical protein